MARKAAGTQVTILGVNAAESRRHIEESRKREKLAAYAITEGSVYSIGLAYPPPGILPLEESAVAALTVGTEGALIGATCGRRAHLFWMTKPLLVADLGVIPGVREVAGTLAADADGIIYGAGGENGGPLFSCDTRAAQLGQFTATRAPIRMLPAPFKSDGTAGLALSRDGRVLAGIADRTGRVFLRNAKSGKVRLLPPIAREGESFSRVLCAGNDGCFYGSAGGGQLFRLSPEGDVESLPCSAPCRKGKAELTRASSLTLSRSGRLYGGTEDGYLFSFNPATSELISHGRANDIPGLHALAEAADGAVYGITGRGEWASHLVRFRPDRAEWSDLGMFHACGHFPWTGYHVVGLVSGRDGQLFAGERDRFGHLFIYHPPARG